VGTGIGLNTSIACYRFMYFGRKYTVASLKAYFKLSFEEVCGEVIIACVAN